jgi:hypothetical protein
MRKPERIQVVPLVPDRSHVQFVFPDPPAAISR